MDGGIEVDIVYFECRICARKAHNEPSVYKKIT
jgi:hypothetical protein